MDIDNLIPAMAYSNTITDSLSVIVTSHHPRYRNADSVYEKTHLICDTAYENESETKSKNEIATTVPDMMPDFSESEIQSVTMSYVSSVIEEKPLVLNKIFLDQPKIFAVTNASSNLSTHPKEEKFETSIKKLIRKFRQIFK